jgi:hypothetical protein
VSRKAEGVAGFTRWTNGFREETACDDGRQESDVTHNLKLTLLPLHIRGRLQEKKTFRRGQCFAKTARAPVLLRARISEINITGWMLCKHTCIDVMSINMFFFLRMNQSTCLLTFSMD